MTRLMFYIPAVQKYQFFSDICDGVYGCVCLCMIVFLIFLGVPGDVGI